MFPKLTRIVTNETNGIRTWRDHVNKVFAKFHGNELGARKADAFAAQLLNLKNANTLFGLEGKDGFEAAEEILAGLCTRPGDSFFGDGYYDFFQPVLEVNWVPEGDGPEVPGPITLGVFTTVLCDADSRCLEFRQSLKLHLPTVFGGCEYHDVSFHEWRLMASGDKSPLAIKGLSEEGQSYLVAPDNLIVNERAARVVSLKAAGQLWNHAPYIDLLRCVQTMEMDRIVEALGEHPRMSFLHAGSGDSLYEGFIQY